ncbi:MAG: hypothetical protein HPY64_11225 [Anaerolineae bacterium]|nr:hypothetical protein [Anaerolineae bacterium]
MLYVDLVDTLTEIWGILCDAYDVTAELPEIGLLFAEADLNRPDQAAEIVLANMLSEIIERIGRFSPCYKLPAEAFGLVLSSDRPAQRVARWVLSPAAVRQWKRFLTTLGTAIARSTVLIQAAELLDGLPVVTPSDKTQVLARCVCQPPRLILVNHSVFEATQIICHACHRPFEPVEEG